MKARDIMRKRVLSVTPQTTLTDLALLLAEHHVSGVPVLGTEGDLIGIVSQTDLVGGITIGVQQRDCDDVR